MADEPVDDSTDEQDAVDDDLDDEPVEDEDAVEDEQDGDDDGGGYTPAFEASQVRTDADRQTPTSTSDEDEDTDESTDDSTDEDGDDSTDEQPEGEGEIPDLDPDQLKPALDATFSMVAVNRGEHWKLDDEEAEKLAEGWCPVINHYAPHFMKEYTELGAAAMITFSVMAPRLAEDRRQAEQARREEEAEETAEAGTVRQARTEEDTDTVDAAVDEQQTDAAEAPGGYASV